MSDVMCLTCDKAVIRWPLGWVALALLVWAICAFWAFGECVQEKCKKKYAKARRHRTLPLPVRRAVRDLGVRLVLIPGSAYAQAQLVNEARGGCAHGHARCVKRRFHVAFLGILKLRP